MTSFAGVDLSLLKSGVALGDGRLRTIAPSSSSDGYERHWEVASAVLAAVAGVDLVVIEGYAHHGPGAIALIRAAEVGGIVRASFARNAIRFVEVPPSTLKRWATGNGNARKEAMVARAVELGARLSKPKADDEADAFLLRLMALEVYTGVRFSAWPDALSVIAWPSIGAA